MDIFVIYSFKNEDYLKKIKKSVHKNCKLNYLEKRHNILWKFLSYNKIKNSDIVLIILGKESFKSQNIRWEILEAKKLNKKIYVIKVDKDVDIPIVAEGIEIVNENLLNKISNENKKIEKVLFNKKNPKYFTVEEKQQLFDEYKILIQTSESLISRRQTMNTFFLTANGVLISIIGIITGKKVEVDDISSKLYLIVAGVVGLLLCYSWRNLITSYGQLNRGKFNVMLKIEKYLTASIFDAEWLALGEGKNPKRYKSFTENEKYIPYLFGIVYIAFIIYIILFVKEVTVVKP